MFYLSGFDVIVILVELNSLKTLQRPLWFKGSEHELGLTDWMTLFQNSLKES